MKLATNTGGGVAAGHEKTAEAAYTVLEAGGNAWDAALAAMAAACVVEPVLASPGGGGFMLAFDSESSTGPVLYDFFAHTPQRPRPAQEVEFFPVIADFGTAQQEFHIGAGSVAVPGMIAGMAAIHADLCRMPMANILEPAILMARDGYEINDFQSYLFSVVSSIYNRCPESLSCFGSPDGGLVQSGERVCNVGMADTFQALASEGPGLFQNGDIAQKIVAFSNNHGGHLSPEDLSGYDVVRRTPLHVVYGGANLYTNPPPSTGGVLVGFGLHLLEALQRENRTATMVDLVRVMEATNHARLKSGLRTLEPNSYAKLADDSFLAPYKEHILTHPRSFRGTTHISVIDRTGNAASVTLSNGEGCGHMLPGTGFMLNNMLGEEDINPRGFHNWPPGTRMCSMMAPSLISHAGGGMTVLGSGGSNRIRTAILQVVRNLVDLGMDLDDAIEAPRIHCENNHLSIEGPISDSDQNLLSDICPDSTLWPERNMFFGGVHAVTRTSGRAHNAKGDPRRGGAARLI